MYMYLYMYMCLVILAVVVALCEHGSYDWHVTYLHLHEKGSANLLVSCVGLFGFCPCGTAHGNLSHQPTLIAITWLAYTCTMVSRCVCYVLCFFRF